MRMQYTSKQKGFTLLELSIVLVIIGLLAGGVLSGKELINQAHVRATVSQYDKLNTAMNAFRGKFNGMPGDLRRQDAITFGLCPEAGCPAADGTGFGDGNGVLVDTNATNVSAQIGENLAFWLQLSKAGLIPNSLGNALTNAYAINVSADDLPGSYFLEAKLSKRNYWIAGSGSDSQNYFMLSGISGLTSGLVTSYSLSPQDSYGIDSKLDDGKPNTGLIQARQLTVNPITMMSSLSTSNAANFTAGQSGIGNCTTGATPIGNDPVDPTNVYALYQGAGETDACVLRLRMM